MTAYSSLLSGHARTLDSAARGLRLGLSAVALGLACAVAQADTVLLPRSKAEHSADLKELEQKYGAKTDPKTIDEAKTASADLRPDVDRESSAASARIQLSLTPGPGDSLRLHEDALDSEALILEVERLRGGAKVDSLVLLEDPVRIIGPQHLVALQRIADHFGVLALYQRGGEVVPVGLESRAPRTADQ